MYIRAARGLSLANATALTTIWLCVGCAVAVSDGRVRHSAQSTCGLEPNAACNQDAAVCIAKTLLAPGESPVQITVRDLHDEVSHDQPLLSSAGPVWAVMLITGLGAADSQCGSSGCEVWVSQRDGRVVGSWPWVVDCVP